MQFPKQLISINYVNQANFFLIFFIPQGFYKNNNDANIQHAIFIDNWIQRTRYLLR